MFHAFTLLKAAKEARQEQINKAANPPAVNQETQEEAPSLDHEAMYGDWEETPPSNRKVELAKEDVKDAMYHLWDVASDASGTKMNITGQRYTAKDLPKALRQVMEALVKLGYVKFSDITEKLLERMKASENWKHLVDAVTPKMLQDAYNSLPYFDGKETAGELESKEDLAFNAEPKEGKRNVTDLVKALPNVVRDVIQRQKGEFKDHKDLGILIKRRMKSSPEWSHLTDKLSDGMVKNAYEQTTREMGQADENESSAIYKKGRTKSAADVANEKMAREAATEEPAEEPAAAKDRPKEAQLESNLVDKIRKIYKQSTNAAFYQGLINDIERQIREIEDRLRAMNSMEVTNPDGSVTTYYRRDEGSSGMEEQVSNTGRAENPNEYYEQGDRAVFDNPDTKASLLAKKRILELDLRNAMEDKLSKSARIGKLGIRTIKRNIETAINSAVRAGLPMEAAKRVGDEWIGAIDGYLGYGKAAKEERQAAKNAEMQEFLDSLKSSQDEAALPSDTEFSHGIWKDISTRKISVSEAIGLVDQAASRGELDSKKRVVSQVLTELVSDYGTQQDAAVKARMLDGIMNWASKAKKEGLLRFDDFVDIFHSNNLDVPHEIVKMGEVAASRGLLEYMAANKHDPAYRYYWLRSMDRVVRFRPESLDSPMFTDLERDLYDEWKEAVSGINNRRKQAYENGEYSNLLFNRFSLADMRNPERLKINDRMRLKELYSDFVEAYFNDMLFALRNGYGKDLATKLDPVDAAQWQEFLDRKNKAVADEAERTERQKYFKLLSQFKHIGDATFEKLYRMMSDDSVANLPMIYDMAIAIEKQAFEGRDIDVDTGEISKIKSKDEIQAEIDKLKSGEATTIFKRKETKPKQELGSEGKEVLRNFAERVGVDPDEIESVVFAPDSTDIGARYADVDVYIKGQEQPKRIKSTESSVDMV